jgi:uncharacterized protein YjbJ (UPF0337 family)
MKKGPPKNYVVWHSSMSPEWVKEEGERIKGRLEEGWGRAIEWLRRDVEGMRKSAVGRGTSHRRRA